MTLSGFEQQQNEAGEAVDYAQSWLCILDDSPTDNGSAHSPPDTFSICPAVLPLQALPGKFFGKFHIPVGGRC
jgi:hypothetical protein